MSRIFITLAFLLIGCIASQNQPIKIGIIADCQYCDCGYNQKWDNDYRKSPERLRQAVAIFNRHKVDMVFHLGDLIDRDFNSYDTITPILKELTMPYHCVLGNHDFSVADSLKSNVYYKQNLKQAYYTVQKDNWLFVILDGTEITNYHSTDSLEIERADSTMEAYCSIGREQAKPWNGAISCIQLEWLKTQLEQADKNGANVIVMCHFPVLPEANVNLWNDAEVVVVLEQYKSVKAYFGGHHHPGNFITKKGIHYITFQGMVLSKNENAFAIIELTPLTIVERGFGREPDRTLKVRE